MKNHTEPFAFRPEFIHYYTLEAFITSIKPDADPNTYHGYSITSAKICACNEALSALYREGDQYYYYLNQLEEEIKQSTLLLEKTFHNQPDAENFYFHYRGTMILIRDTLLSWGPQSIE